jgi:hypothetical protein
VRNLKYRLDKIKTSETKLKLDKNASLTNEQLDAIKNKKTIVISLEESEKMCETIKETINTFNKNTKVNNKEKEENIANTHNKPTTIDNKVVKFQEEEIITLNTSSPQSTKENQDKDNRVIVVEEKITEKIV